MSEWNKQDTKRSENPISFLHSSSSFFLALKVSRSWTKERGSKKKSGIKHERNKQRMKERLLLFFQAHSLTACSEGGSKKPGGISLPNPFFIFITFFAVCSSLFAKAWNRQKNTISYLSLLSLFLFFVSHLILYFCRRVELYRLSKSQFIVLPSPSSKSAFWRKVEIHLPLRNATVPWYRLSEQKFVYV